MITVQSKYGCLTVLDMGEEYVKSNEYVSYVKKYKLLKYSNLYSIAEIFVCFCNFLS